MTTHWSAYLPRDACRDTKEWARRQPDVETAWDACMQLEWMERLAAWLSLLTPDAQIEYSRVTTTAWNKFMIATAPMREEYERVTMPAWRAYMLVKATADHEQTELAWADYRRVTVPMENAYVRATGYARAEYTHVARSALRRLATRPTLALLRESCGNRGRE